MYVDDIKIVGKKQNISEPTSFPDHVYLGCSQRECQISKDIVDNYRNMFDQGFPPGLQKNCQKQKPPGNLMPKRYFHGPTTRNVMQRNAWKDIANLRIK